MPPSLTAPIRAGSRSPLAPLSRSLYGLGRCGGPCSRPPSYPNRRALLLARHPLPRLTPPEHGRCNTAGWSLRTACGSSRRSPSRLTSAGDGSGRTAPVRSPPRADCMRSRCARLAGDVDLGVRAARRDVRSGQTATIRTPLPRGPDCRSMTWPVTCVGPAWPSVSASSEDDWVRSSSFVRSLIGSCARLAA